MLEHRDRFARSSADNLNTTVLLLEITRGATRHPVRPVLGERFLIGASAACDLRLGAADLPPLHSLIVREADGRFRWDRVACNATLKCNGEETPSRILEHGDLFQIGPLEVTAYLKAGFAARNDLPDPSDIASADLQPSDLSASELAERLQRELDFVESFESRRRLGFESLLNAVAAKMPATSPVAIPRELPGVETLRCQLERLARQIDACAGKLDSNGVAGRENSGVAESMALVIDAEARLNRRMAVLLNAESTAENLSAA